MNNKRERRGRAAGRLLGAVLLVLSARLYAQSSGCDQGQILGVRPEQNAKIVVCSEAARRLPQLQAQIARLTTLIQQGGREGGDARRLLDGLNETARQVPDRSDQLVQSLARVLAQHADENNRQVARALGSLALQLEDLDDKLTARARDPRTAAGLRTALNGKAGDAIASLDVATAGRLLDEIAGVRSQLASVEGKVDTANVQLSHLQSALACTPDKAWDAIHVGDAPAFLRLVSCNRDVLRDSQVRRALAWMFQDPDWESSGPFREALRAGGVNFLRDLPPSLQITHEVGDTPLQHALYLRGDPARLDWLLAGATREDVRLYPDLLMPFVTAPADHPEERLRRLQWLVQTGASVEAKDYQAYRLAAARYIDALILQVQTQDDENWNKPQWRDQAALQLAFYRQALPLIAPPAAERARIFGEVVSKERSPAVRSLDQEIQNARYGVEHTDDAGLRNERRAYLARKELEREHILQTVPDNLTSPH